LSQEKKFCPKCGAELVPGSVFCSSCGSAVSTAGPTASTYQAPPPTPYGRGEKHEKAEKHEKREKHEKGRGGELGGALIGGGILIWLGILVYLQQVNTITSGDFGGYFLIGIGFLLVLSGVARTSRSGYPYTGMMIGGVVLALLGFASTPSVRDQLASTGLGSLVGPLILIFFGLLVIFAAISARRRSPRP
jgi:uncharacterized Zn finger protein (UPF0148 family)